MAEKIEIPKKLWFVKKRGDTDLAYVSYYDETAACKKKQETGRNWANGYQEYERDERGYIRTDENGRYILKPRPALEEKIVDNEPLAGWKIKDDVKRWSTQNVAWRIESPHGFEFEIYSGNMMEIIKCSTIKDGVIQDKCVIGKGNVLLPESSEPYRIAMEFTRMKEARNGKPSEMKPGDNVVLATGKEFTFCGRLYVIEKNETTFGNGSTRYTFSISDKPYYFFTRKDGDRTCFEAFTSVKLLSIQSPEEPDNTDYVGLINGATGYVSYPRAVRYDKPFGVCPSKDSIIKLGTTPLDVANVKTANYRNWINGVIVNGNIYSDNGCSIDQLKSDRQQLDNPINGYSFRIKDGAAELLEHRVWQERTGWGVRQGEGYWRNAEAASFRNKEDIQSLEVLTLIIDGKVYPKYNGYLTHH